MSTTLTMDNFSTYEPMQSNWFAVQFDDLSNIGTNGADSLSIACHTCSVPKLTTIANEFHRINDIIYTPGKSSWSEISLEFYEYMKSSTTDNSTVTEGTNTGGTSTNSSAGLILKDWQKLVHNPLTGVQGSKKAISKNMAIVQFDGAGNKIRSWNVYHAWPTDVDFDGMNSKSGDGMNVKVTLRYDYAVMSEPKADEKK